jgi:hypothetical protein
VTVIIPRQKDTQNSKTQEKDHTEVTNGVAQ